MSQLVTRVVAVLRVVVSDRIEPLFEQCVDRLRSQVDDPFERAWVAVPTTGMRRWLRNNLRSHLGASALGLDDGIVAHIDMPLPPSLTSLLLGVGTGTSTSSDHGSAVTQWQIPQIAWAIYQLGQSGQLPDELLAAGRQRVAASRASSAAIDFDHATQLASLLQRYLRYRPDMVVAWTRGADHNATGEKLITQCAWQPELLRSVRSLLGPSPAELSHEAISSAALRTTLPRQATFFAYTAVSGDLGPALHHVAQESDVLVQLLVPSVADFEQQATHISRDLQLDPILLKSKNQLTWTFPRKDLTHDTGSEPRDVTNRPSLLASWGTSSRETAIVATVAGLTSVDIVTYVPSESQPPETLLQALQANLRDPEGLSAHRNAGSDAGSNNITELSASIAADQRSVQLHHCVGRVRQVEALRDAIFHALREDADLGYDDVAIVCPDIDLFLPAIRQVLGAEATRPDFSGGDDIESLADSLPYSIVDYPLDTTDEYTQAFVNLIALLQGRCGASEIQSFLSNSVVSTAFEWDQREIEQLGRWISDAPIRWGLNSDDRSAHVPGMASDLFTWEYGLNRLVVGAVTAVEDQETVAGVRLPPAVPLSSDSLDQLGQLRRTLRDLNTLRSTDTATVAEWATAIEFLCQSFFGEQPEHDRSARRVQRALHSVTEQSLSLSGIDAVDCSLSDFLSALQQQMAEGLSNNVRRPGSVLITAMAPSQRVPSAIVGILGLDADALPKVHHSGDDLVMIDSFVGDLDARSEFRQQILSCILSAEQCLIITTTNVDRATNKHVPPPPILIEFVESVASLLGVPFDAAWEQLSNAHSRHAHETKNFVPAGFAKGISGPAPWSADPVAFAAALQERPVTEFVQPSLREALSEIDLSSDSDVTSQEVEIGDLINTISDPLNAFLRNGVGGYVESNRDSWDDDLPLTQTNLEAYDIRSRAAQHVLSGENLELFLHDLEVTGQLPPAALSGNMRNTASLFAQDSVMWVSACLKHLGVAPVVHSPDELDELLESFPAVEIPVLSPVAPEFGSKDFQRAHSAHRMIIGSIGGLYMDPDSEIGAVVEISGGSQNIKREIRTRIHVMCLTALFPERTWYGIHVIRPGSKTTVGAFAFSSRGEDPTQRRAAALSGLANLVRLFDTAHIKPVPLTPKTSDCLARDDMRGAYTAWNGGHGGASPERKSPAVQLLFGDLDFDTWKEVSHLGMTPETAAIAFWSPLSSTTIEVKMGLNKTKVDKLISAGDQP